MHTSHIVVLKCATFVSALASILFVPVAGYADSPSSISFVNDVVPVLTKAGCNSGACHAKSGGGQNGFQLSLFGYEPADDYQSLVKGGRGRRVFPGSPEQSLLLAKATARAPHGGGQRLNADSDEYQVLRQWIEQSMPFVAADERKLISLTVTPPRSRVARHGSQQLVVTAAFSDSTVRDVTRLALFESNSTSMANVSSTGLVTVNETPGSASIMVRFQDRVSVFSALVPLDASTNSLPPPKNFIDEGVFASLKEIGLPASTLCDDSTFLRRSAVDISGRLPTVAEAEAFLADTSSDKRDRWIETMLRSSDYADYFANKWTTLLKNRRDDASDITSNFAFHSWVRDSLLENKPYDQWVRELLAATGTVIGNPPVAWYKRVKEANQQIEDVAQLFLGVRMQCAQCHHHPFERWSQNDYYSLTAFFSRVGRKPTGTRGEDLIYHQRGVAESKNMRSGEMLKPAAFGDAIPSVAPDDDPRLRLADWMADPKNPFFAKAVVNRYWKHFFKRGLIEPEDDIRDSNPATHPELLATLERHFIESHFDLRALVRAIVQSQAYQLSALPNEYNERDMQNFSRFYPRRMQAEVLLDAIDAITGAQTTFSNLPVGTRAIALPDNSYNKSSQFLTIFGRPESTSVCECERVQSSCLGQSLHMLNAAEMKAKLATAGGRADRLAKEDRPNDDKIRELYLAAFARVPSASELQTATAYLIEPRLSENGQPVDPAKAKQENFEDLLWALISTKEFLFNH